jgi:hypothetical protein
MVMMRSDMKREMIGGKKEPKKADKGKKEGSKAEEAMDKKMGFMPEGVVGGGGRKAVIAKSMNKMRGR